MLKALVPIKRVLDAYAKVRVKPDNTGVDLGQVKMSTNPFCQNALEEAVRLKTAKAVSEVTVVSVGPKQAQEVLRVGLAIGADKAIHIQTDERIDMHVLPLTIAKMLQKLIERDGYNFVLLGKQSVDGDCNMTGQLLAGLMRWPQATFLNKLEVDGDMVRATREIDGGLQQVEFKPPGIVTCDLRLNTPRIPAIPMIMKAKKKPLELIEASGFGVPVEPIYKTLSIMPPPEKKAGVLVESVDELIDKLKNEAKVI